MDSHELESVVNAVLEYIITDTHTKKKENRIGVIDHRGGRSGFRVRYHYPFPAKLGYYYHSFLLIKFLSSIFGSLRYVFLLYSHRILTR